MTFFNQTGADILAVFAGISPPSGGNLNAPGVWYVGLSSAVTIDEDSTSFASELSGNGYARVATTMSSWTMLAATSKPSSMSNNANVTFATATGGNWAPAYDAVIFSHATGGDPLFHCSIDSGSPITVVNGNQLLFSVGNLVIQLN